MILHDPATRREWLECRKGGIGGSDAGSVLGLSPYKSNVQLWREKTGLTDAEDASGKAAVQFGREAEVHIRALFALQHPEYRVEHHAYRMYAQPDTPYLYATLDGELHTQARCGVLEIKTAEIRNTVQWKDWDGRIPAHYYVQVLHQLHCTGWDFAVIVALLRYRRGDGWAVAIREYYVERAGAAQDIAYLKAKEITFWQNVLERREPALILPEIGRNTNGI